MGLWAALGSPIRPAQRAGKSMRQACASANKGKRLDGGEESRVYYIAPLTRAANRAVAARVDQGAGGSLGHGPDNRRGFNPTARGQACARILAPLTFVSGCGRATHEAPPSRGAREPSVAGGSVPPLACSDSKSARGVVIETASDRQRPKVNVRTKPRGTDAGVAVRITQSAMEPA